MNVFAFARIQTSSNGGFATRRKGRYAPLSAVACGPALTPLRSKTPRTACKPKPPKIPRALDRRSPFCASWLAVCDRMIRNAKVSGTIGREVRLSVAEPSVKADRREPRSGRSVAESLYGCRSGGYGHVPGFPRERSLLAWDGSVAGNTDAEDRAFVDSKWNHRDSIWNRDRSKSPGLSAMPFGITNALCMTLRGMECHK